MLWSLLSEQIVSSEKQIVEIQLNSNKKLRKLWSKRQKSYEKERNRKYKNVNNTVSPIGGVGGAVNSIKCLHSHLADELVTGKNIVGQIVLENVGGCNCNEPCVLEGTKNDNWRSIW